MFQIKAMSKIILFVSVYFFTLELYRIRNVFINFKLSIAILIDKYRPARIAFKACLL